VTADISQEISGLGAGRDALQRLLGLTLSLETLRVGLQSSLQLGKPQVALSNDAIQLYLALGKKIRNLSDRDIRIRLSGLDLRVKSSLEDILPLIETFTIALTNSQHTRDISAMIDKIETLARLSRTAVTLRVLLHKRGLESPVLQLSVPNSVIQEKLGLVEQQERKQRQKAEQAIKEIEADLNRLLITGHQSAPIREILTTAMNDMERNRAHLQAGLSIEALPVSIEHINFSIEPDLESNIVPKPIAEDREETNRTHVANAEPNAAPEQETGPHPKRRFWRGLFVWLSSPWHVRWRDIKDDNSDE